MNTTISHHVSDGLLLNYSAGNLPEGFNIVIASHLSVCDDCRARAESFDSIGGTILDIIEPVNMISFHQSLRATQELITASNVPTNLPCSDIENDLLPAPLNNYVGDGINAIRWRPIGMGAKQSILSTSGSATARLLFVPAGSSMPNHSHKGLEVTLVLKGALIDGDKRFEPGDVQIIDNDTNHSPIAGESDDCICLTATDHPLQFKSLMPRLLQPFLRI
ncbi:MAG: ChrR family anti-sigma-E factor [Aestuariivita sp.]|nr:ChrR family anti-sigma-E factor [Aestuariivita sp.]